MTVRQMLEKREMETLSPFAMLSAQTQGRQRPLTPCDLRTAFQRDRDRIIHCKSFRRLKHKTQMFLSPLGDHYRTRLTHTLEVAQIARTITRALSLNEDLAEAIALGHDLGHTPFGHMGERTLDRLSPTGFSHNEQSLRIVEELENGEGLNLTSEVRDGIRHHSGNVLPKTLEGVAVHLSDRIAYLNHDVDDVLRAGFLKETDFPRVVVMTLGRTPAQRIDTMIRDIVKTSAGQPVVYMSAEIREAMLALRSFMFDTVYLAPWAQKQEERTNRLLEELYRYYTYHPTQLPTEHVENMYTQGVDRAVCDFIAGMTDRYALETFEKLFIPCPLDKH